ncbi:predicted protein [Streptomyces sp. AA4]|uniref:beta/gamma crystallin domain-containing protein n=2 Tax=Actinomycetes TaxID=1760 RepID=UPI0001B55C37|nr:beta/gamma crystallin domain-containing protein [Amycolatopsis sp. AA4]EFL12510.1 predicted protein [Streptomyces sp. AA4]
MLNISVLARRAMTALGVVAIAGATAAVGDACAANAATAVQTRPDRVVTAVNASEAHADSSSATQTAHVIRPNATSRDCGLRMEVHFTDGTAICWSGRGSVNVDYRGVDWVETGNQWVALVYNGGTYQPGMPPGTFWNQGSWINRIDLNT